MKYYIKESDYFLGKVVFKMKINRGGEMVLWLKVVEKSFVFRIYFW